MGINFSKWKDWRLEALNDKSKSEPVEIDDDDYIMLKESFYHLNSEAKLGLSLRQIRKHLTEIEKQYKRTIESAKVDEAIVERWARAYSSLVQLDERLHNLMKSMYRGKK